MSRESKMNNLIDRIRGQLPTHATSWGQGMCGHNARGCRTCIDCLEIELAEVVGAVAADEYVTAEVDVQAAIYKMYDSIDKLSIEDMINDC